MTATPEQRAKSISAKWLKSDDCDIARFEHQVAAEIRAAEKAVAYGILKDVKVSVRNEPRGRRVWIDIEDGGYNLGPDDWTLHPVLRWWERVRKLLPGAKP